MAVQRMTEHTRPLVAISKDPKEQHLSQTQPQIIHMDGAQGTYLDKLRLQERVLDVPRRSEESQRKYHKFIFPGEFERIW